jgi:hypothetical protein
MAKTPARSKSIPPAKPAPRKRGCPPQPGGPKPQAEIQRAYRARLAAAGKVLKLVDADAAADLAMVAAMREKLHDALLKLELRDEEVARLAARNHQVENELTRVEQCNLNILKELIELRKAAAPSARARPRAKSQRQRDA